MVVVRLMALECIRTGTGELEEEPYLNIWSATPVNAGFSLAETWGPVDIRTGQTRQITSNGEHVVVEGVRIQIELYESDDSGSSGYLGAGPVDLVWNRPLGEETADVRPNDDLAGVVVVREHYRSEEGWGEGSYVADLRSSDGSQRYKLYFELYLDQDSLERGLRHPYSLQLISIHCRDAQEGTDEVLIKVNGEKVWGHEDMKTGQTRDLSGLSAIPIRADATISLWEKDSSTRSDCFGEFSLHVDEDFDFGHDQPPHTFHRDRGIVGDARYTLTYRVTRRFSELRRWLQPRILGILDRDLEIVDRSAYPVH